MKKLIITAIVVLIGFSIKAQKKIYYGNTFVDPLFEKDLDTLIIDSCLFENISGHGVRFRNIKCVEIKNSRFKNISEGAIQGRASGFIHIHDNIIDSITYFAIRFPYDGTTASSERSRSIIISDNTISNIFNLNDETGGGIRIFHADSVNIINNDISWCEWSGVQIGRNSSASDSQKVNQLLVKNNQISYTLSDGILTSENVYNALVTGNTISYVAYDSVGGRPNNGDHGIYWQAPDGIIESNEVFNVFDDCADDFGCQGSGISVRTSAKVLRNKTYNCTGAGIGYYNDHPAGDGPLIIANNIIYDNDRRGIYLNGPKGSSQPDSVFIFHNTVISKQIQTLWHHSSPIAIKDMNGYANVSGNIMVYEDHPDTTHCFWKGDNVSIEDFSFNIQANLDIGFTDYLNRELDLTEDASLAIDKIHTAQFFVENDFYGNIRDGKHDIGAVEYDPPSNAFSNIKINPLSVFPNPANNIVKIGPINISELERVHMYDSNGRELKGIKIKYNTDLIDINMSELVDGLYFVCFLTKDNKVKSLKIIKE